MATKRSAESRRESMGGGLGGFGKVPTLADRMAAKFGESSPIGQRARAIEADVAARARPTDGVDELDGAQRVEIDRIVPDPDQPRKTFDPERQAQMVESLGRVGQISPITIIWRDQLARYMIVVGERRHRAAKAAGWKHIDCKILDPATPPEKIRSIQIIENLHRDDVPPMEQAEAFASLKALNQASWAWVAKATGFSEAQVFKVASLATLAPEAKELVSAGTLAPSVAYETLRIPDAADRLEVQKTIAAEGLKRPEAIALVNEAPGVKTKARPKAPPVELVTVGGREGFPLGTFPDEPGRPPLPGQLEFPGVRPPGLSVAAHVAVSKENLARAMAEADADPEDPDGDAWMARATDRVAKAGARIAAEERDGPPADWDATDRHAVRINFGDDTVLTLESSFPLEDVDLVRVLTMALDSAKKRLAKSLRARPDPLIAVSGD